MSALGLMLLKINITPRFHLHSPLAESEVSEASFCSDEGSSLSIESTMSSSSVESVSSTISSASTVITESTKARRRQLVEGPPDSKVAKDVSCFGLHR